MTAGKGYGGFYVCNHAYREGECVVWWDYEYAHAE